ncbi:hypothetical protein HNP84_004697 [Thermocatellispora tengchongensis]|uniref:TfuA-like core domain-containing protein n=1 Tax=Thermocatellispora tengchongensis TaxID=1073253 RepID=A0A840PAK6_9ACTN|nr:TfuA domain-containing protein [Thermocatellispora tengchongensis]MBB5134963.1 hypothetical protein [Thermocatellispora tengchongensis]
MAEIVAFVGPTLPRAEIPDGVRALPPVAQGDVARLVALPPSRRPGWIAIVDGVYERVPAVWHKEILWALSEGIWVGGAASMGALRAAELVPYGMAGVGAVYAAAVSGELVDDDEVAVAHLGPEDGYRPVSAAMVDIRAALAAAAAEGLISQEQRAALTAAAKRLHYPDRRWPALVREAPALEGRGPGQGRGVKADDARELLRLALTRPEPPPVTWHLEQTEQWRAARPAPGAPDLPPGRLAALFDGLRRDGSYPDLERAATLRLLAARHYPRPSGPALAEWVARVRSHVPAADLADLDDLRLGELAADQAALVAACAEAEPGLPGAILDVLRIRGQYAEHLEQYPGEGADP